MNVSNINAEDGQIHATQRPRRRWFQFSLRTMIVATAIFCTLLATWIIPSERQRRACKKLYEQGGTYSFPFENNVKYFEIQQLRSGNDPYPWYRHYFNSVSRVNIHNLSDIDWGAFPRLESLSSEILRNSSSQDMDQFVATLARHNRLLKELSLYQAEIQLGSMDHLPSFSKLEKLNIVQSDLWNCSLDPIASLQELREINFSKTIVQDREIAKLKNLPNLKKIHVEMPSKSADLLKILCDFRNLTEVTVLIGPESKSKTISIERMREILKEYNEKSTAEHPHEIMWD